jgi:glycosyltransferase involved in cell wall biosynthesis
LTFNPKKYDVIFTHHSWIAACVKGQAVVYWADAEFDSYSQAYASDADRQALVGLDEALAGEQFALDHAARALFASQWAIDAVKQRYAVDPAKLVLAPLCENLTDIPSRAQVEAAVGSRGRDRCRFLFIGVDWARKGGDRALRLVEALRALGVPAELDVVGVSPFAPGEAPPHVRQHGFLDRANPAELQTLKTLLTDSHFLVLASRAEAMGIVLVEANAFGLPAITSTVGGISSVITDGLNGLCSDFEDVEALAQRVKSKFVDPAAYASFCLASRGAFERSYSWDVRLEQVRAVFDAVKSRRDGVSA